MDSVASVGTSRQTQRHGRLVQAVFDAFAADPDNAYTTADLAMRAYGVELEGVTRAHRVAMQRAMKRACEIERRLRCRDGEGAEGQLVVFDCTHLPSYAMLRLKVDSFECYQWQRMKRRWGRDFWEKHNRDARLREKLAEPRYQKHMQPGGAWSEHVEFYRAELAGDTETAARLKAKHDAEMAAWAAGMQAMMGKRVAPAAPAGQTQQLALTEDGLTQRLIPIFNALTTIERKHDEYIYWLDDAKTKGWRLTFVDASAATPGQTQRDEEQAA